MTAADTLAKLPVEMREPMVDAIELIILLRLAKREKPRLTHDFNRIIADLQAEVRTMEGQTT